VKTALIGVACILVGVLLGLILGGFWHGVSWAILGALVGAGIVYRRKHRSSS
jgi:hypothetical protein